MSEATAEPVDMLNIPYKGLLSISIMLATIMQVLDTTIANVALPSMRGSLGASQDQITWVLTSYIVASAIITPVTGWLSDRFGLRQIFIVSAAGFVVASMACGMASSLNEMVAFRVLQGLFGACLVPLSQTVLLDINPRERHGQAMAIWGMGVMLGPIIGPTLGGWLTENWGWRYVFYVNLPVGILAIAGMLLFLPKTPPKVRRFDFFGFAMLAIAIGALQMVLDRGQAEDWFQSTEIWIETGLFISGLWVFGIHIRNARDPFISLHVLKDKNLLTALALSALVGAMVLGGSALLPAMLQDVLGYTASRSGLIMAPRGFGTMIAMMIYGRLSNRIDSRIAILLGLALTAWSMHMMTGFSVDMGEQPIIMTGVIQGFGLGLVFVPLSTLAYATLESRFRAEAAGVFNLVRNIGSSVGISLLSTVLAWNIATNRTEMTAKLVEDGPRLADIAEKTGFGHQILVFLVNSEISLQAAMIAYLDDFKLMMIVTFALMPLVLLLRKPGALKVSPNPADAGH
ncbi:DHA2 family efflux MFS transporter permease subunit [Martelella lutilitoris]|uniref:DHA2 family efflux MFS transporter permease subunit n=1 Tax=Martelella lutilitoris TaxID=2583532 RepID=A0A5C4JVI8_9HYPH|nr:DHA2 family efflux MFS transporter permease subunit [Martelella lutilitoris]TNB48669.1 DHA2 family efflux MFS transporter permease subunit [Martelella lutilitoris]